MSRVLNSAGEAVADIYHPLADEAALPGDLAVIVSHARWLAQGDVLSASAQLVALQLPNTLDVGKLGAAELTLPMFVLEFPTFADGRAYSQATLLRQHGYQGVLRATGAAVVADQLLMLKRCGIDEFDVRADQLVSGLIDVLQRPAAACYQPGLQGR